MSDTRRKPATSAATRSATERQTIGQARERLFAAGGVIGALLAASCCIVPLLLVTLGISGAWIGNLTAMEPYKPYVIAATAVILGAGFWQVYARPKTDCAEGSCCACPSSLRMTKVALWIAIVVMALAATIEFWAPLFY